MTEEEKKAIEELEEFIKGPCETCKYCEAAYKLNRKNIMQLLNLTKKLQKENEELKQDKNDNYQMIALAQNELLGYMQGYEDGKKLNRSAVACVVENQQYYIIKKEIEHYKEYIEKLQKENAKLKEENEHKTEKIENQKAELAILNDKQKDYNKLQNIVKSWKGQYKRLQKEYNKLKEYTKANENELTFDVDCDWDALQKALDETEKNNEYIVYDNEKWIKEKYCVPIQEIKDIIEELEEKMFCEHNVRVLVQLYKQKQILLELLERRK